MIKLNSESKMPHTKDEDFKENNDNTGEKKYSYEVTNFNKCTEICEGQKELKLKIKLKNNKNINWPRDASKLTFDTNSDLIGDDTNLRPQTYNEEREYEIEFPDIDQYPSAEYNCSLNFEVNGEKYGESIDFKIIIKEINKDLDKVKNFREIYSLPNDEYPDDKLLDALQKNNFNFQSTFSSLFN